MDIALSTRLSLAGFKLVLGTTQWAGGYESEVGLGEPGRFDSNNGVMVVFDEDGKPWIHRGSMRPESLGLSWDKVGAGVPHSNDGGAFIDQLFPRAA